MLDIQLRNIFCSTQQLNSRSLEKKKKKKKKKEKEEEEEEELSKVICFGQSSDDWWMTIIPSGNILVQTRD